MNLYKLHTNPEKLIGGNSDIEAIPIIADIMNYYNSTDEMFEETIISQITELDRRVPDIEKAILSLGEDGVYLMDYYSEIMFPDKRWPEAELIIQKTEQWEDYKLERGM